jgi:hypothetical protein
MLAKSFIQCAGDRYPWHLKRALFKRCSTVVVLHSMQCNMHQARFCEPETSSGEVGGGVQGPCAVRLLCRYQRCGTNQLSCSKVVRGARHRRFTVGFAL